VQAHTPKAAWPAGVVKVAAKRATHVIMVLQQNAAKRATHVVVVLQQNAPPM
jgi:hypothetical protein